MSVAEVEFKEALKNFPGGVTIVTSCDREGRPFGATVSSFASLSLNPPLVVVCLSRGSRSIAAIRERRAFVVHFLGADQAALARQFAADSDDKFSGIGHASTGEGVPYLVDCPARLECQLQDEFAGGDHEIVVGVVSAVHGIDDFEPLVYARRNFFALGKSVG
jgi:flavin reductase ActVB